MSEKVLASPKNPQVLELLARTFSDMNQIEKAKSVYVELSSVLQEKGNTSEHERIQAKLRALGITAPQAQAPSRSQPTQTSGGEGVVSTKVLQEVEIFMKYGLVDKACTFLSQSVLNEPQNEAYRSKLIEAYQAKADMDGLVGVLTKVFNLAKKLGNASLIQSIQIQIDSLSGPVNPQASIPIPEVVAPPPPVPEEIHSAEIV